MGAQKREITATQLQILKDNFGLKTMVHISKMTGINPNTLQSRAKELGFKKHEVTEKQVKNNSHKMMFSTDYSLDNGYGNFDIDKYKLVAL